MQEPIKIFLCSPPDREKLVVEIMIGEIQWAEISQEKEQLEVEIYPHPSGDSWRLDFDVVVKALADAKKRLVG